MFGEEAPKVEVLNADFTNDVMQCGSLTESHAQQSVPVVASYRRVAAKEVPVVSDCDSGELS